MFLTKLAHYSQQSVIMDEDESLWHVVQLVFQVPWFVVTMLHADSPGEEEASRSRQTVLIPNVTDLERLKAGNASPLTKIKDVYVVLPPNINQSDGWTMERLSKVWSAELPVELGSSAQLYETIDGTTYCHPTFKTLLQDVRNGPPFLCF